MSTIEINGRNYVLFHARLKDFLISYPAREFPISTEWRNLATFGGVDTLYLAAFNSPNGASMLPSLETKLQTETPVADSMALNHWVVIVKMANAQGVVLRQATAMGAVTSPKDMEKLETAAHQRLIALCGFGSEVFASDEIPSSGVSSPAREITPIPAAAQTSLHGPIETLPSSPTALASVTKAAVKSGQIKGLIKRLTQQGLEIDQKEFGDGDLAAALVAFLTERTAAKHEGTSLPPLPKWVKEVT